MAEKACHVVTSTAQVGLIQALGAAIDMAALKVVRLLIVFAIGAYAGFSVVFGSTIWLGIAFCESKSGADCGNAGALYYFLGLLLATLSVPFCGVLAAILVERIIKSLAAVPTS